VVAITSISPTHINANIQSDAIKSWIDLGFKVYSFNSPKEIETLNGQYDNVEFVPTYRTMEITYGKPLVSINAVLDWAKEREDQHYCLINSDIELIMDLEMVERVKLQMDKSIVLDNRIDYDTTKALTSHKYMMGIDVFFIHKKWLSIYPQSMHCFGMTFWDYFIPYVAIQNGVDVKFIKQNTAYHKKHSAQYSMDNWKKSGRFFLWEAGLYQFNDTTDVGKMSTFVFNYIYNASKRIEI